MLAGQLADGIATPTVGYLSDKFTTRWGRRTPWYIFGTVLIIPTFYGTFNKCLLCAWSYPEAERSEYKDVCPGLETFYYLLLPSLFNVGKF